MERVLDRRQAERSGLSLRASGLGAMEGEEQEMLLPSLIHGSANPHAYQVHRRLVDRRQGDKFRLPLAQNSCLVLSPLGGISSL